MGGTLDKSGDWPWRSCGWSSRLPIFGYRGPAVAVLEIEDVGELFLCSHLSGMQQAGSHTAFGTTGTICTVATSIAPIWTPHITIPCAACAANHCDGWAGYKAGQPTASCSPLAQRTVGRVDASSQEFLYRRTYRAKSSMPSLENSTGMTLLVHSTGNQSSSSLPCTSPPPLPQAAPQPLLLGSLSRRDGSSIRASTRFCVAGQTASASGSAHGELHGGPAAARTPTVV
jgi:hypothetical protein